MVCLEPACARESTIEGKGVTALLNGWDIRKACAAGGVHPANSHDDIHTIPVLKLQLFNRCINCIPSAHVIA